jgi:hypothetical protein
MWLRLRLFAVNAFIATILLFVAIDTVPQAPDAVRRGLTPLLIRIGINQGNWNLFGPEPDKVNTRWRAEITYRDGEKREWRGPNWAKVSAWDKWVGHRHVEWYDHFASNGPAAWEPWCRRLARSERPDFPEADRGAEVKVIYEEATNPPADLRPWPSIRQPAKFDQQSVLTIEKLE